MTQEDHKERERFFGAAKVVAAFTMLSRVLGLVRDMVIVPLGTRELADCFWVAFSVPNLFRRLFGEGALSAAFVPVFTEVAETDGWDRARVVLANVAGMLAIILIGLTLLITAGLWAAWAIWGGDWHRMVLLQLTALMLPFMFTVCMLALGSAALNCRGHFAYPAFAPIILNVSLIIGATVAAPLLAKTDAGQFYVIGTSLLVAGVLQMLGVVLLLRRVGLATMATFRPVLPEVKRIGKMMAPMFIPLSVLQFSAFADRLIAKIFTHTPEMPNMPLTDGAVRCLYAANRLFQLPLGVLAISIATVVFPLFSRYAARNDHAGLRETTNRTLRLCLFLGIPSGVALMLLARPLISLMFERHNFTEFDTDRSAFMLQMYCIGMWAYFCNQVLLRAFFAIKETRKPLLIACSLVALNLAMVLGGIFTPLKGGAIGLATACTASINSLILIWLLRRRWGQIGFGAILQSLGKIAVSTGAMGFAIWAALRWLKCPADSLGQQSGQAWLGAVLLIAAAVVAGVGVYFLACRVLNCRELSELRKRTTH